MSTAIEIHPCKLGDVAGFRVVLVVGETEKAGRPFVDMDAAHDYIDELFDQYEVDTFIDKAVRPGRDVYYDLSDQSVDDVDVSPNAHGADVIPLFPNNGGRQQ